MRYIVVIMVALALLAACGDAPAGVGRWTGHCWPIKIGPEYENLGASISFIAVDEWVFLESQTPWDDGAGHMLLPTGRVFVSNVPPVVHYAELKGHSICATRFIERRYWHDGRGYQEWYEGTFR